MGWVTRTAAGLGAAGGALMFAAQTKPEDATSNLEGWARLLHLDYLASRLSSQSADTVATIIGAGLVAAAVGLLVLWFWRKGTRNHRGDALQPVAVLTERDLPILQSQAEPREGSALLRAVIGPISGSGKSSVPWRADVCLRGTELAKLEPRNQDQPEEQMVFVRELKGAGVFAGDNGYVRVWVKILGDRAKFLRSRPEFDLMLNAPNGQKFRLRQPITLQNFGQEMANGSPPTFAPPARPVRDTKLDKALSYIVTREWEPDAETFDAAGGIDAFVSAITDFEQAARDNEISVWGHEMLNGISFGELWEPVPPEFWRANRVKYFSVALHDKATTERRGSDRKAEFEDLEVSRAQIERKWPRG